MTTKITVLIFNDNNKNNNNKTNNNNNNNNNNNKTNNNKTICGNIQMFSARHAVNIYYWSPYRMAVYSTTRSPLTAADL